jgi:hypothetical protein
MRRKFAMIAAFVVAISGAIATKASPKGVFLTKTHCHDSITCSNSGTMDCGVASDCTTPIKKIL